MDFKFPKQIKKIYEIGFDPHFDGNVYLEWFHSDVNKDGCYDVVVFMCQTNIQRYDGVYGVYLGTKESGYHLQEEGCFPSMGGGDFPLGSEISMTNDKKGCILEITYSPYNGYRNGICIESNTIVARFQDNYFYVIGESESSGGYVDMRYGLNSDNYSEEEWNDDSKYIEEYKTEVTRNFLTHKERDEITGKATKLPNEPLKKLSEYFSF